MQKFLGLPDGKSSRGSSTSKSRAHRTKDDKHSSRSQHPEDTSVIFSAPSTVYPEDSISQSGVSKSRERSHKSGTKSRSSKHQAKSTSKSDRDSKSRHNHSSSTSKSHSSRSRHESKSSLEELEESSDSSSEEEAEPYAASAYEDDVSTVVPYPEGTVVRTMGAGYQVNYGPTPLYRVYPDLSPNTTYDGSNLAVGSTTNAPSGRYTRTREMAVEESAGTRRGALRDHETFEWHR